MLTFILTHFPTHTHTPPPHPRLHTHPHLPRKLPWPTHTYTSTLSLTPTGRCDARPTCEVFPPACQPAAPTPSASQLPTGRGTTILALQPTCHRPSPTCFLGLARSRSFALSLFLLLSPSLSLTLLIPLFHLFALSLSLYFSYALALSFYLCVCLTHPPSHLFLAFSHFHQCSSLNMSS